MELIFADATKIQIQSAQETGGTRMKILDLKDSHRYNLQFDVDGQFVKRTDNNLPVSKCKNLFKAKFNFIGDEWTGTKTALFAQGEYSKSVVLDDNDECVIPWEFFDTDENMTIGKVSVSCGDLVTTNCATVKITKSGYQESDASVPPSPDVYQQLIELAEDTKKIAQSVREDAHAGEFDGEEGYSPKVSLTEELDGVTVTVQNKDGQQSAKVKDGKDYEHSEEFTRLAEQVRQDKESVEQTKTAVDKTAQDFTLTAQQALADVNNAGQTQSERVQQVGQDAIADVNTAKTQAVGEVNVTKSDAVKAVQTEGAKQTEAVQAKGQEVINSIPSDFTTQMATKLDKQQGVEHAGKALIIGDDGNVVPGEVQGGGNGLVGEVLLADYTHQGNPEFHFSDFDFATGIGTTAEPHGLTTATSVLICPNDFEVTNFTKNVMTLPIEWTMTGTGISDQLQLVPVDDTHLKLVAKKTQEIIPVNLEDISNKMVDITKFHFEKAILYHIKNLDNEINTKYIKVKQFGYCGYIGNYRYRKVHVRKEDGSVVMLPNYINTLGFSFAGNAPAKNGVLQASTMYIDIRNNVHYEEDLLVFSRRAKYSSLVFDQAKLLNNYNSLYQLNDIKPKTITEYQTYANDYAYMSNGTRIQIYALEGEYKNES